MSIIKLEKNLKKLLAKLFTVNIKNINIYSSNKSIKKWDSLGHIRLIMAIEQKYNIKIDQKHYSDLLNFKNLLRFIIKKSKK